MSEPALLPTSPIRILIVEDDQDDVALLKEDLAAAPVPFEITVTPTLAEALHRLDEGGLDVVVSDLSLPDSRGLATFRALEAHSAHLPILILSGVADEALALETVRQGAQDYLVKGQCEPRLLVRALRYAIQRAKADRALAAERNLLRSVIDNLVDAIYVKDLDGRYLLGNQAHARQLGLRSPEEVVGRKTADLFTPETAQKFEADDARVLQGGEPILNRHERVVEPERCAALAFHDQGAAAQ